MAIALSTQIIINHVKSVDHIFVDLTRSYVKVLGQFSFQMVLKLLISVYLQYALQIFAQYFMFQS